MNRAALLALVAVSCSQAPALDGIRDVRPASVEIGEKLVIETSPDKPALATGSPVTVKLHGWAQAPGAKPMTDWQETLEGRATAPEGQAGSTRVLVDADESLRDRLGGHVEFHGVMTLEGTDVNGKPVSYASAKGLTLQFFPRSVRRLAYRLVGHKEQNDLLEWLGVQVKPDAAAGGIRVDRVNDEFSGVEFITRFDCGIWDAKNKICRAPHDGKVSRDEALAGGMTPKQFEALDTGTGGTTVLLLKILGVFLLLIGVITFVRRRIFGGFLGVVGILVVGVGVYASKHTGAHDGVVTRPEAVVNDSDRSPAAAAGLHEADVIVSVAGRKIDSVDALAKTWADGSEPTITLDVVRNGAPATVEMPRYGKPASIPAGFLLVGILFAVGLLVILPVPIMGGLIVVWERKIAGRMQSRPGPNRVGPGGWLQFLADGIKLIVKEDLIPTEADPYLFRVSPYLVFIGVFATFVVLPFSQSIIVADLNVGILYLLSVTSLVVVGIIMGGWASNSKWSLLGGMRSAAQIISYELPASIAVLSVVTLSGTLSTQGIVLDQGGAPWHWHLFDNPFTFACFFIYFISALAEGNRTPFDLPEAESELVAGYNTEYSGFRFSIYFLAEWVNLIVIGSVATTVFLGGWRIPRVPASAIEASLGLQLLAAAVFGAKVLLLIFVIIWVRWTLPRFRVDQMMNMCWKYFLPISLASFLFTAGWVVIAPRGSLPRTIVQFAMFAVFGLGTLFYFLSRVQHVRKTTKVMSLRGA